MNKPLEPAEYNEIAQTVACAFCGVKAGEPCVVSFPFPQYAHSPRFYEAEKQAAKTK